MISDVYQQNNKSWHTAIYIRLSQDDKDKDYISDSVINQELYIRNHLAKHPDIHIYDIYIDDGYTGTNFNRPNFKRLMTDMKVGRINCIIVKDLSRLGREYLSVGNYLERVFPSLGVRFISIMQNIDSHKDPKKMIGLEIPFLSLINEQYAIDISKKTRASLQAKRKAGKFVGVHVPYGYMRHTEDKSRLVLDNTVAEHVKSTFSMFIKGCSMNDIAEHFNQLGILSPIGHFVDSGQRKLPKSSNIDTYKLWTGSKVHKVLKNPLYTGDLVQGMTTSYSHKVKKRTPLPKEQWIVVPDTHEALVSKDIFVLAQELLSKDTKPVSTLVKPSIFSGYIYCADCGCSLVRNITIKNDKQYCNYLCSNYKKHGKAKCSSHFINEDVIKAVVLSAIQFQIRAYNNIDILKHKVSSNDSLNDTVQKLESQYDGIQRESKKSQNLQNEAHKDFIANILQEQEYLYMTNSFKNKERSLAFKKGNILKQISNTESQNIKNSLIQEFLVLGEITQLSRSVIVHLIDGISIYRDKSIKIKFKFQDHFNNLSSEFDNEQKI